MSIIAKYKFDSSIYADLLPEFNAEFTSDKYNTTDEEVDGIITRTIESDELPTLMRFGRAWVSGESTTNSRTDSLLEVLDMDTSGLTDCSSMFRYCTNLTSIACNWDTSKVINMNSMFTDCQSLTSLDVSNWDTSNVTIMGYMFYNCNKLTSLDVSNWNTSNVTNMSNMFDCCLSLTEIHGVSNWNASNVTNMCATFGKCESLTELNLSGWDTSSVTNADNLFGQCFSLATLDISNFKFSTNCNINKIFNENIGNIPLTDIGMLYCDQSTINKIASALPTDITQTIWVEDVDAKDLTPVEGVEFKQYAKNTEIMLTSPLLEGDKIEVIDGKTYHYHKMGMVVLDGSEDEDWHLTDNEKSNTITFTLDESVDKEPSVDDMGRCSNCISNNYKSMFDASNIECFVLTTHVNRLHIAVNRSRLVSEDENGFKQWLQANPTTVVYELASPYYELISNEPLNIPIVSETADITNSSNIPINMIVNNSPLSTIAMNTSTEYTVAFDKSENTSVVVDLCGSSIETTDNVVHITTSSEMMGDRLTIYGNGEEISNVRVLEGNVSGDSIPRESFKGLKNSFEDGYIENMVNDNRYACVIRISTPDGATHFNEMYPLADGNRVRSDLLEVKPNTTYTVHSSGYIVTIHEYNSSKIWIKDHLWQNTDTYTFTTTSNCTGLVVYIRKSDNKAFTEDEANSVPIILSAEEDFNHVGKYKVEYKVTGKNKIGILERGYINSGYGHDDDSTIQLANSMRTGYIKVDYNKVYYLSNLYSSCNFFVAFYDEGKNYLGRSNATSGRNTKINKTNAEIYGVSRPYSYIRVTNYGGITDDMFSNSTLQLEEGTTATPYEPYKEDIKTYYLSSPLLEGDTIQNINGVATHIKRKKEIKLNLDTYTDFHTNEILDEYNVKLIRLLISEELKGEDVYFTGEKPDTKETLIVEKANVVIRDGVNKFNINDIYLTHDGHLWLAIDNTLMSVSKEYIEENVGRIIARLASPIYEPISTESILCDSYVNGHLDVDSAVPIEKVEFKHFDMPLVYSQPNTTYKVQFEADNNGMLDNLDISGGKVKNANVMKGLNRFTVTTPNELLYNWFTMAGIGFNASNIQVVATDKDVDFGYFKGLQSSFENNKENLWDGTLVKDIHISSNCTYSKANDTRSACIKCKPNTTYIITATNNNRLRIGHVPELVDGTVCMAYNIDDTNISYKEFTTTNREGYLIVYVANESNTNEDITVDIREKANRVECKVVGKNKFDKTKLIYGSYIAGGGGYGGRTFAETSDKHAYIIIPVKPNTQYRIYCSNMEAYVRQMVTKEIESGHVTGYYYTHTFTTFSHTNYLAINIRIDTNTILTKDFVDNVNIQLEEGTQATEYEPYQEYTKTICLNSPLLKGDTIEVHNGKLCHYHKMDMVVFDGSEDEGWVYDSGWKDFRWNDFFINHTSTTGDANNALCDKIAFVNYADYLDTVDGSCILFYSTGCTIRNYNINQDIETFRKWLQANPLTVVYKLIEPYYEEIVPMQEDLIITSVKEGDLHIDTIVPISSKVTYNVNVQLLTDFEQSIVEQVQATQTTDLQSILDEEIDN